MGSYTETDTQTDTQTEGVNSQTDRRREYRMRERIGGRHTWGGESAVPFTYSMAIMTGVPVVLSLCGTNVSEF